MDKDSIILKYLENETADCKKNLGNLNSLNCDNAKRIDEADNKLDEIYKLLNKKRKSLSYEIKKERNNAQVDSVENINLYDEIFTIAADSLVRRGIDIDNLDYHNLVTDEELKHIIDNLNRPLENKLKWTKSDFIVVFIAASIGSLVDLILSNRDNKITGKGSQFSEWLDQFHNHDGGGPIDYQGKGFGGGFHRELSKGHDILRFVEAIIMFKTGEFEGRRYVNGVAYKVISKVNQYDTPYEQLNVIEAIIKYSKHMFADLFSKCSLPFPGSSFFGECSNKNVRILAATMYRQGFNIKNIMIQSLSTVSVEIVLRIYFAIYAIKIYKDDIKIEEDYSNFQAISKFIESTGKEKLYEMLLLAHIIITAVNVGKVVITKKPWEINVTEIISVIRYSIPVLNNAINRHSEYAKLIRNANEINKGWEILSLEYSVDKLSLEFPSTILTI